MKKFKNFKLNTLVLLGLIFSLIGCKHHTIKSRYYVVRSGDTLYAVARKHKISVQNLAKANGINAPYVLHKGRRLVILNHSKAVTRTASNIIKTYNRKDPKNSVTRTNVHSNSDHNVKINNLTIVKLNKISWVWPAKGKIIKSFVAAGPAKGNGVDIAGSRGDPVLSAANGKVVYAGNNLRGYGNLVIIKHNEDFLSAYAHNDKILVSEQQVVTRGQKIASMGSTDAKFVKLHFEVRYKGKPIDPVKVLERI